MTHLTDVELVDRLDGPLAPSRERHLDECESCRATAARMRDVLALAAHVEAPEPSPLFWEHFSARVRDGLRGVDAGEPVGWFGWAQGATAKWAMSGALLTLLLVVSIWASIWRATAPVSEITSPGTIASMPADDADPYAWDAFDPDTDEAWALVRTVADDVRWDDAATDGLGVRPGAVEHALAALTGAERSELVRLLEAATKQPGA